MKNILIILLVFSMPVIGVAQDTEKRDHIEVQVDGLGCPFCAYGLEKKFKEWNDIKDISIEMETGLFSFTIPAISFVSIEDIQNHVDAAGYTAVHTIIKRENGEVEESKIEKKE